MMIGPDLPFRARAVVFARTSWRRTFVLFCTDESASPDGGARKWALVSWVPDLCRPKDKMLYSSVRSRSLQGERATSTP